MTMPAYAQKRRAFGPRLSLLEIFVFTLIFLLMAAALFGPLLAPNTVYNSDIVNS